MSYVYRVYSNDGHGGPVNYATPIGSTTNLSFTCPALPASSDTTFVVRTYDAALGIEESNTDVRVRILIDQNGQDISGQPKPPDSLFVRPLAGGCCRTSWSYAPTASPSPVGFLVYLTQGITASYTTPAATVPYAAGRMGYSCVLTNLLDGVAYTVAVRAYNSVGTEPNTNVVARVVGDSTPPSNVDSLQVVATAQS
jgi:hypothetical protein